ncbi:choice-of-anchor Q domain-containing protein, partial [Planctomycetota bacterium]
GPGWGLFHYFLIDGGGNIDEDPCFVDSSDPDGADDQWMTADDGLVLAWDSPCINDGDNTAASGIDKDLKFDDRIFNGTVDMGAYEFSYNHVYVDVDANGSDNGMTWANAYVDLQDALSDANVTQIWVAEGTYYPDGSDANNRSLSFGLVEAVNVYGGFDGNSTDFNDRNWGLYETILSGDINTPNDVNDNSYHVVTGADDANLDGFTVTMGNADGSGNDQYGGGFLNIQASPNISNCIIKGNYADYGGGIFNYGISTDWSLTDVTNCLFFENEAIDGGAVFNYNYTWDLITNCTFSKNDASNLGGAVYAYYSYETDIVNSILWGDTDSTASDYEIVSNGTLEEEATLVAVYYSDVNNMGTTNGGEIYQGSGILTLDPCFADADSNDFHLKSPDGRWNGSEWVTTDTVTSWCVNTGNPSSGYSNEPSPNGSRINMGAYGNTTVASKSDANMVVYVDCDNTSSPFLGTPDDPYQTIEDGTDAVGSGGIVYVLDGTYYENLSFDSGDDFSLIAVGTTIIDGEQEDCVILLNNADNMVVDGFYITGGKSLDGGGMALINCSATIKNCRFYENLAYDPNVAAKGGGIYVNGDSPLIQNCDFANNTADGGEDEEGYWYAGSGGAIFVCNSRATFENCNVGVDVAWYLGSDDNHADYWINSNEDPVTAYEIYILDCEDPHWTPTFTNCTVRGNGTYTYTDGGDH